MEKDLNVSPSLEDYLETLLQLQKQNGSVRVTDVAVEMNISKPSVNKAIKILKTKELVEHEHYGLLELTEKGTELALNITNRHILLKKFLEEILKVDEATAEEEACRIEHTISSGTIEKLSAFVNGYLGCVPVQSQDN